jgi:hypothetical protein
LTKVRTANVEAIESPDAHAGFHLEFNCAVPTEMERAHGRGVKIEAVVMVARFHRHAVGVEDGCMATDRVACFFDRHHARIRS